MKLVKWEYLPDSMRNDSVKKYYDILLKKKYSLFFKRIFDVIVSLLMLILLSPIFVIISMLILLDSKGSIFYTQKRITQYGKKYRIIKFRTMISNADVIGPKITVKKDSRITRIGYLLRRLRIDEIPQLLNILYGDMTFVGTRPEVEEYVNKYTDEMNATLLLPAGVTSMTSIQYRNESEMLSNSTDVNKDYIDNILPKKMEYNLLNIENFSFFNDIKVLLITFFVVLGIYKIN